ncbi:MAG: archaellin/type IV pilin N-terminal domain-containing protein [Candidatus Nanoarchaeia archaeon]
MNKRGVSPVIATVLLIGIVIALGLIVFFWFKSFTQEAVTKFGGENVQLVCNDVKFDGSYSPTDKSLAISNTGNVPIYNFNVQINGAAGAYTTQTISSLISTWPKIGINQGGVFSGNIPANDIPSGATGIVLIPILMGSSNGGQQQSYTCGSQSQYQISLS